MQMPVEICSVAAPRLRPFEGDAARDGDKWADPEIAGCVFKDARLGCRFGKLLKADGLRHGREHSSGLPGLGEHQSGLSLLGQ